MAVRRSRGGGPCRETALLARQRRRPGIRSWPREWDQSRHPLYYLEALDGRETTNRCGRACPAHQIRDWRVSPEEDSHTRQTTTHELRDHSNPARCRKLDHGPDVFVRVDCVHRIVRAVLRKLRMDR